MQFNELLQTAEQPSIPAGIKGRRRLERNDQVSPHLISLLRAPAAVDIPAPPPCEREALLLDNQLAAARGIAFGLALSVPLWAVIAGAVWAVLR
jgi:hypothetical protein